MIYKLYVSLEQLWYPWHADMVAELYGIFKRNIYAFRDFPQRHIKLAPHRRDDGSHDEVLSIFYLYIKCVWDRGYINLLCHIKLNLSMFCKKCDSLYTSCLNTGLMMNSETKFLPSSTSPAVTTYWGHHQRYILQMSCIDL